MKSKKIIRIGLAGAGFISGVHASATENLKNVVIDSVFDIDKNRAQKFAEKYGVVNYYDSFDALLKSEIDAVVIGLPTPFHKEYSIEALSRSKHVLCEKPIALKLEDADEMIKAAEKSDAIFMIAHVLRFWSEYVKVKQLIDEGSFGNIKKIYAYRFSDVPQWSKNNWLLDPMKSGGVPVDLQIHDLDFIRWLMGEPSSVFTVGNTQDEGLIINSSCLMQYANSTAVAEAGYIMPLNMGLEMGFKIITDSAIIDYNNLREPSLIIKKDGNIFEAIRVENKNAYSEQISYFTECIRKGNNPERISTSDAKKSLELSLKIKSLIEAVSIKN